MREPRRQERTITNELGNAIKVRVAEGAIGLAPAVRIVLEGPSSTSETWITRQEARTLLELLSGALGPAPRSAGLVQEVVDGLRRFTWRGCAGGWRVYDKDRREYVDGPFAREAEASRLARKRTAEAIIDLVRSGEADA